MHVHDTILVTWSNTTRTQTISPSFSRWVYQPKTPFLPLHENPSRQLFFLPIIYFPIHRLEQHFVPCQRQQFLRPARDPKRERKEEKEAGKERERQLKSLGWEMSLFQGSLDFLAPVSKRKGTPPPPRNFTPHLQPSCTTTCTPICSASASSRHARRS